MLHGALRYFEWSEYLKSLGTTVLENECCCWLLNDDEIVQIDLIFYLAIFPLGSFVNDVEVLGGGVNDFVTTVLRP